MKVITAVKKYLKTNKEIFLQSVEDGNIYVVNKEKNFVDRYGTVVANTKVHHIDENESPDAVTIYL